MNIKYRVWDGEKMWYPGDRRMNGRTHAADYFLAQTGDLFDMLWDYDETPEEVGAEHLVMLWTGCEDKNRKEMYQDDILKHRSGRTCKVVWLSGIYHAGWDLNVIDGQGEPPGDAAWDSKIWEVIGNIHEDPELLGGSS